MREWVSKEDEFVLKQSKKKARIRVREGRARTIDWLAVTLSIKDAAKDLLEDDEHIEESEIVDPSAVFEGLSSPQLKELAEDIKSYLLLEVSAGNRRYWKALKAICEDYQRRLDQSHAQGRGRSANAVCADVDRLLSPKNLEELEALEKQIRNKLRSHEPIDIEYWEDLLQSIEIYKSRAELSTIYQSIILERLRKFRREECAKAASAYKSLETLLDALPVSDAPGSDAKHAEPADISISYSRAVDPEPMLRLRQADKALEMMDEKDFLMKMVSWPRIIPNPAKRDTGIGTTTSSEVRLCASEKISGHWGKACV